ncbi:Lactonase, 7-bladed beta-propeller-domain-containing protein [Gymnopilus junonius]|uniref:Lactonase, 7-bladed beta-propeller-domain-containing protein n=1 Tax=Gymnopilus junonius TaxID=109634 RepID=A0A9P5TMJ9_GYMJU|nr:Lactonase, 7-bladed beta-propeller-domain-containing protein [Gymnopilus junonius]
MDAHNVLGYPQVLNITIPQDTAIHHILAGSFRSLSSSCLPSRRRRANQFKNRVYATTWAQPPALSSWQIEHSDPWRVSHINNVSITATSSYITVPPPYTHVYSVGGPTGESHVIDLQTGGFGEKMQELLFIPEDDLSAADKTRVALRYGSHGIEFTPSRQYAFVPVLGTNSIEMYNHDAANGKLSHIASIGSPRGKDANDGPRHVKIHPNGRVLYCVTEHSNYVDAYRISSTTLEYISSRPLIPATAQDSPEASKSKGNFRGDTLMLSPSTPSKPNPDALVTTTRGSTPDLRGWLSIIPLNEDGTFATLHQERKQSINYDAEWFQTPTSGGKANAIDILSKNSPGQEDQDGLWILLTDDDDVTESSGSGAIRVLEWDGWEKGGIKVVVEWPSAARNTSTSEEQDKIQGASHAIWLD